MKNVKLSKKFWKLFILILLTYLSGFLCYIPLYSALILAALVSAFLWNQIAYISNDIKNRKAKKLVDFLPFYKTILSVFGYLIIELPDAINIPQLNLFTELDMALVLTVILTQIKIFEARMLLITNSNIAVSLLVFFNVAFMLIPILSYFLTQKKLSKKRYHS